MTSKTKAILITASIVMSVLLFFFLLARFREYMEMLGVIIFALFMSFCVVLAIRCIYLDIKEFFDERN